VFAASPDHGMHRNAIRSAAQAIVEISRTTKLGAGNFNFAATALCPAGTPFFPAAYHEGEDSFAIGLESPNLISDAARAGDAAAAPARIRASFESALGEAARTANGDLGHRHHLSHIQLIHPDDQPRFRKLGAIANFQPLWAYADDYITELTLPFISKQTATWMYPIASMEKSGAVVAFGSDWSVSSANPFEEMETAITRMGALGETKTVWMPEERITLPEALAAFTINAAYTNRDEKDTGSLEVGKRANLAVLDRNLFEIPASEISDTKVLLTLFEGKPVHGDPGTL